MLAPGMVEKRFPLRAACCRKLEIGLPFQVPSTFPLNCWDLQKASTAELACHSLLTIESTITIPATHASLPDMIGKMLQNSPGAGLADSWRYTGDSLDSPACCLTSKSKNDPSHPIFCVFWTLEIMLGVQGYFPNNVESCGKEHVKINGSDV